MKKFTAFLLAIVLVLTCSLVCACIFDFHTHDFGDSYFMYVKCAHCNVYGRNDSENVYAKDFVYDLDNKTIAQIRELYADIKSDLSSANNYGEFEVMYQEYEDFVAYAVAQYQIAAVLSDVKYTNKTISNYNTASAFYNEVLANYYGLYALIYQSDYRNDFFSGWSADEIDQALALAEMYSDGADNRNEIDQILGDYSELMEKLSWDLSNATQTQLNKLNSLYSQLVIANNNLAQSAKYDNYMDYAYANEYYREYTPAQVQLMRNYVKTYIAPIFVKVASWYQGLYYEDFDSYADEDFYYGLMEESLFAKTSIFNVSMVRNAVNYVGEYFKYLTDTASGSKEINFYYHANELFKNGNYFTGEYQGAYTWWIDAIDAPILYFGLGDYDYVGYDTAFTLVHEFGHYYENIHNGQMKLSYDHDETHSQGNEMLFLAWLSQNKSSRVKNGFNKVESEQLFDILANIVMSTAVDEFEQAAYSGYYNDNPVDTSDYGKLFETILNSYSGAGNYLYSDYWSYVVFDNSAYYISYAMSALPSLELYAKAMGSGAGNGLNAARDAYFKLFTFSENSDFVEADKYGNAYVTATYQEILNWCGLQGPFQEGLYTSIRNYFNSRTDVY